MIQENDVYEIILNTSVRHFWSLRFASEERLSVLSVSATTLGDHVPPRHGARISHFR